MEILEIELKNPISFNEINRFRIKLLNDENGFDFLIVNTGAHDFESVQVIKYFRDQFELLKDQLSKFKKIALIRPSAYANESTNPEIYNFFDSKEEAEQWFLK